MALGGCVQLLWLPEQEGDDPDMDAPGMFDEPDDADDEFDLTQREFDERFDAAEPVTVIGLDRGAEVARTVAARYVLLISSSRDVPTSDRVHRGAGDARPDYRTPVTSGS